MKSVLTRKLVVMLCKGKRMTELRYGVSVHVILGRYGSLGMLPNPHFPDNFELGQKLVLDPFIFVRQEIPFQKTLLFHQVTAVDSRLISLS